VTRARVLLADDNLQVLERVKFLLESSFDIIGVARNGNEMISIARSLSPDIIVADITMPGLTGLDAAHQIIAAGYAGKIVFLTVNTEEEFIEECFREGAYGYVVKSHMKTDLVPAIHAALLGEHFISPALRS
jgi:DNA-binding NarL/FixJ family response regulator